MKKLLALILGAVMIASLASSCSASSTQWVASTLSGSLSTRGEENKKAATRLYKLGIIDETAVNNIHKNIDAILSTIAKGVGQMSTNVSSSSLPSSSSSSSSTTTTPPSQNTTTTSGKLDAQIGRSIIAAYSHGGAANGDNYVTEEPGFDTYMGGAGYVPFEFVDKKTEDMLNNLQNIKIMVLDPSKLASSVSATGAGKPVTVDELNYLLNNLSAQGSELALSTYFKDSGQTLFSGNFSLAGVTSGEQPTNGVQAGATAYATANQYSNVPGKDLIITQDVAGIVQPVVALRLRELNIDGITEISDALIATDVGTRYVKHQLKIGGTTETVFYLTEYPVKALGNLSTTSGKDFTTSFVSTKLVVNLMDSGLYKEAGTKISLATVENAAAGEAHQIYRVSGSKSPNDEQTASFKFDPALGKAKVQVKLGASTSSDVDTAALILTDYIEGAYLPGVNDVDKLILTGRLLRLQKFSGGINDALFKYVSYETGKVIAGTRDIKASDILDITSMLTTSPSREILGDGSLNTPMVTKPDGTPDDSTIDKLALKSKSSIDIHYRLPSASLMASASANIDTNNLQHFFPIVPNLSPFDTGMFSDWLNKDSATESYKWWLQYLKDAGFNFDINSSNFENYFSGNYRYDMAKEGYIIIDLETVAKIQTNYNKTSKTDTMVIFRTTVVILGFTLIAYAFVLMALWAVDTNLDVGANLLQKATFGRWVAVKYSEEFVSSTTNEAVYIDFSGIIKKFLIIAAFGTLLTVFDIVTLIAIILNAMSGFIQIFENLFM